MKLKIGENIRKHRRLMNVTQQELAKMLGVSYQAVSRWEMGATYPDLELIPSISELFGISTDDLLGLGTEEKEKEAERAIDEFVSQTYSENIDAEHLASMLREIRREYLHSRKIMRLWNATSPRTMSLPEILDEMRITSKMLLDSSISTHKKNVVITYMAVFEQEEKLEDHLREYASSIDISRNSLLTKRYLLRKEWRKYDPYRAWELYYHIDRLFGSYGIWNDREKTPHLSDAIHLNRLGIGFLNGICRSSDDDMIVHNGEVDCFVRMRLFFGFRRASHMAQTGQLEVAFLTLEDSVSLLERLMAVTEPVKIACPCPWMEGLVFEAKESWQRLDSEAQEERGIYIYAPNVSTGVGCVFASWFYRALTDKENWKWFEPIRGDDRFGDYVSRVERLIQLRPAIVAEMTDEKSQVI